MSLLHMTYGQFLDHDLDFSPVVKGGSCALLGWGFMFYFMARWLGKFFLLLLFGLRGFAQMVRVDCDEHLWVC